MSKLDILRGYDMTYAKYDEIELFLINEMMSRGMYKLKFGEKESFSARGKFMDDIEDLFPLPFTERYVPRHWRDHAIKCLISNVCNISTKQKDLHDPDAPPKRQCLDIVTKDGSPKKVDRNAGPKQKTLLAYCSLIFRHHHFSPTSFVVLLRELLEPGARSLDDN
jgi:hypothetical protein